MRVGFLYPEMETLGIQYLSSVLKTRGHETKLFFDPQLFDDTITQNQPLKLKFDYKDKLISEIDKFRPDVIVFSVLSTTCEWAFHLSLTIKAKMDIPIVFGGIHPTLVPEEVMRNSFIDYAIVGEGEYALLELVESGFNKNKIPQIKNVCYKKNEVVVCNPLRAPIADLDTLPFPDKELFYEKMPYLKKSYTIVTGRGCPHGCSYCCNGYLNKIYNRGYLRRRSAENVIAELDWAVKKYGIKHVYFDDSTFTYDRNWLSNFAVHYKKIIGLPCFCWVYPTDVDEGLIGIFKSLNCRAVEMGVESLDERVREEIFGRVYSNSDVENALKLFRKNRIFCVVDNIKGFSDDPEKEVMDLVEFYNENRPNKIYVFE
ncbi:B12-binding domain-containing radical SAM protein, partial [bacterium]